MEIKGHARHTLDEELNRLEHSLLEMAALGEQMVGRAVDSLVRLDPEEARETLDLDDAIDALDLEIENLCLRVLALQQPAAKDLRVVGTAMKMITDIERIGDLACDIAKAGLKIEKELGSSSIVDIPKIASICRTMILQSLEAYVKCDLDIVHAVIAQDDEVDRLYRELREQIHDHMRTHSEAVVSDSWLLLALHHLERIADHAVNIAERVAFMVTGVPANLATSHRTDQSSQ